MSAYKKLAKESDELSSTLGTIIFVESLHEVENETSESKGKDKQE